MKLLTIIKEVLDAKIEPRVELPDYILSKAKGVSIPEFTPEDIKSEKYITSFLKGNITPGQAKTSSENKIPLRAPQLAIFYLLTTGHSNLISDWEEYVAFPKNTITQTLKKFNKVINGKNLDNEKIKSTPLYNFAIGVFNAMTPNNVVAIAEKEFTEDNRKNTEELRDREREKRNLSTEKSVEKQKKEAELIVLDFQKNRKSFSNEKMLINLLAKLHEVTPEFVQTVLSKASLIRT